MEGNTPEAAAALTLEQSEARLLNAVLEASMVKATEGMGEAEIPFRQIMEDVTSAKGEIKPVERIEVLAYLLTNIQEGFEQLLGERYDEDMLEEIFTNFCIGK